MRHLALLILFITNFNDVLSFCQPGCICFDDGKDVRCDHANLTTFPYMLNPMLKKLSLVDAKLKLLDSASISVYQELEYLDLSNNEIEELPSDFLVGFLKLKEVKLQNNKIRLISDDLFKELPSLEILDLSQNKIERIMSDAFLELKELSSLNLSSNNLHMISSKSFNGLSGLSELDLSGNQFEKLQRETFDQLTGLAYMSLKINKIKMLPRLIFTEQKKLVKLDLGRNSIESIEEGAFSGLHSLKSLDLSSNRLSDISSRNWPYLSELEILDLTKNNFATIYAGFFEGLGSLRSLMLSGNEDLQRIELNAFAGLYKLDFMEARDCPHLNFIDEFAFEHPNQLKSVDFANSALTNLPINLINWRQLDSLELSGNPWKCDCELLRFLPETLKNLRKKSNIEKIELRPICALPEELKGVAIETTSDSNCYTLPQPAMLAVMFGSFIVIIGTIIIAITCIKSKTLCSKTDKEKN
uniref:LRRCT domain-containing protein n=1 Tax=Panagrolaimus sp. ES5 TaxID=591445 RepID=A0AC34FY40_9BILA